MFFSKYASFIVFILFFLVVWYIKVLERALYQTTSNNLSREDVITKPSSAHRFHKDAVENVHVNRCWDMLLSYGTNIIKDKREAGKVNEKWDKAPDWACTIWDTDNCTSMLGIHDKHERKISMGGNLPPYVELPVLTYEEQNTFARLLQVFLNRVTEKNIP